MEQKEIFEKIEKIYQNKDKNGKPVGKNFITHLLRAYFPVNKITRVIDVQKKEMKCAITGQKLFALGEILQAMHDNKEEFMKDMMKHIRYQVDSEKHEPAEHPYSKVVGDRVVGHQGENSDTFLCHEAIQELFNWYATKILTGDKYINWLMNDVRRKTVINSVREQLPAVEDQKKIDRAEQILKKPKRATTSLSDLSILQELSDKLKQEGK